VSSLATTSVVIGTDVSANLLHRCGRFHRQHGLVLETVALCERSPFPLEFDADEDAAIRLREGRTGEEGAEHPCHLDTGQPFVPHNEVEFVPQPWTQAAGVGPNSCPVGQEILQFSL
jgi:hypothetical protein